MFASLTEPPPCEAAQPRIRSTEAKSLLLNDLIIKVIKKVVTVFNDDYSATEWPN